MFLSRIKLFLVISISLIFFSLSNIEVVSGEIKSISGMAEVIDGDTIKIEKKKIRLFGIDAPETKQFCKEVYLSFLVHLEVATTARLLEYFVNIFYLIH